MLTSCNVPGGRYQHLKQSNWSHGDSFIERRGAVLRLLNQFLLRVTIVLNYTGNEPLLHVDLLVHVGEYCKHSLSTS